MNDDSWREEIESADARRPDEAFTRTDWEDPAVSFMDQIMRESWPVRMPVELEIFVEGARARVLPLRLGQERCKANSQVLTLELQFDRAKVREMMLEQIHATYETDDSKLPNIMLLARVDRACFLETAAAHCVELLAESDTALRRDPWLADFLRELHEYDGDLIAELVAATVRADRAAGARLREVILDTVNHAQAREHLGWLVAAAIAASVQEL